MAPPRVEQYVEELFRGSSIKMEVISDLPTLEKEYPLFAAVNRCANGNKLFFVLFFFPVRNLFHFYFQMFLVMLVE